MARGLSGGGPLSRYPVVFTADARLLLVAAGRSLRAYSTQTSGLVLELSAHTKDVTCAANVPGEPSQVYSGGLDGQLKKWSLEDGSCLSSISIGKPIHSMVIGADGNRAFLSVPWNPNTASGRIIPVDLKAQKAEVPLAKLDAAMPLKGSQHFAATHAKHTLQVWPQAHMDQPSLALHLTKTITCVAIDPKEQRVATGDESGRINVWHSFATAVVRAEPGAPGTRREPDIPRTTMHWHAHSVGCLTFSPDGVFLLSGGLEAVLVIWQLETGKRNYLPRLGGALTAIEPCSADPALYVICQADNTIRVVNLATMTVTCSIHGLRQMPNPLPVRGPFTPAVAVSGSGELVVPGDNALLQFFDPIHDRHIAKLQVAPRNPISLTHKEAAMKGGAYGLPAQPLVSLMAFSGDGRGMVTVDLRPDAGGHGSAEPSLKFWQRSIVRSAAAAPFTLVSQADGPHRGGVNGLAYHPHEHMAATAGEEGQFKVWERSVIRSSAAAGTAAGSTPSHRWSCRSVGSFRGEPLRAATFSPDGSLMAVAATQSATLWDPFDNTLIGTLALPSSSSASASQLTSLAFLRSSPTLVGASQGLAPCLVVWDLLTLSVRWSVGVHASCLTPDPAHPLFAFVMPTEAVEWGPHSGGFTQPTALGGAAERGTHSMDIDGPSKQPTTSDRQRHKQLPNGKVPSSGGALAADGDAVVTPPADTMDASSSGDEEDRNVSILPNGPAHPPRSSRNLANGHLQPAGGTAAADGSSPLSPLSAASTPAAAQQPAGHAGMAPTQEGQPSAGMQGPATQSGLGPRGRKPSSPGTRGVVVVVGAHSPEPIQTWALQRAPAAALLFAPPASSLNTVASLSAPSTCSPLLIMTMDREFSLAGAGTSAEGLEASSANAQQQLQQRERQQHLEQLLRSKDQGFNAAFGDTTSTSRPFLDPAESGSRGPDSVLEAHSKGTHKWQSLFDSPSHVLPPLSQLCPAFLELALTDSHHERA
ncbi:hypothetical protein WJX74_006596 [Apatococcus lobatus]|uniref:WD repeat-containing protein 75 second beta-propeller domain-containing protein n=1 Tax=Apatococcus lobatus TaxID=904363 RepID=A0AAW1QBU6_9CHLO